MKLAPCPHCRGAAELVRVGRNLTAAQCAGCGARGPLCLLRESAAAAWNARPAATDHRAEHAA